MKNFENAANLQEMSLQEMENANGGWIVSAITILGACIYLYNEGGDFIEGFKNGFSRAYN